ncbi:hypothetical protein ABZZ16_38050, partial [Streptomyces sp. NPDC006386]
YHVLTWEAELPAPTEGRTDRAIMRAMFVPHRHLGIRHRNDHEGRACSALRPNRSLPDQPYDPETCNCPGVSVSSMRGIGNLLFPNT